VRLVGKFADRERCHGSSFVATHQIAIKIEMPAPDGAPALRRSASGSFEYRCG
jgi:hypothetical protein